MTGRTHDLAAFTALNVAAVVYPVPGINLATFVAVIAANFVGGLAPDLDESTSELWRHVRGGSVISRLIAPMLGGHRLISHSLIGLWLAGKIVWWILLKMSGVVLVDMNLVWYGFMIGFLSHLIADTVTKEGVYWLFPLPIRVGFPPFRFARITTGDWAEKSLVFPGLMLFNGYLFYSNYERYLEILRKIIN